MKHDFDMHNFHIQFDSLFYIVLFYYWHDQFMPKFHPSWMQKTPPMGWNPFWRLFFCFIKGIFNFSLSTLFQDRIQQILFICWNIDDDAVFFWKIDFFSSKMCGMEMVSDMRMSDMGIKDYIYLLETTYINPQRGNDFLWS